MFQKLQPPYNNNASSTIVRPVEASSSSLNRAQQYIPIKLTSTTYLGTNAIQSTIQPQYNNALMLTQPVENTRFSNGILNNSGFASNLNVLRFQGTVTPQSKISQNENSLANRILKEKSGNRNAALNESIRNSTTEPPAKVCFIFMQFRRN